MKTIEHSSQNVCIYEVKEDYLRGSFFAEKPEVGDRISSTAHCPMGKVFEVVSIISVRDAKIAKDCTKNPSQAHCELGVIMVDY